MKLFLVVYHLGIAAWQTTPQPSGLKHQIFIISHAAVGWPDASGGLGSAPQDSRAAFLSVFMVPGVTQTTLLQKCIYSSLPCVLILMFDYTQWFVDTHLIRKIRN